MASKREIINLLECLEDDDEVLFLPDNTSYAEDIETYDVYLERLRVFYGNDRDVYVIRSAGQKGMV